MRSQGCTIQQALTPDAAAVVKQAVALAKRRGNAQVTPLHVAHTMLSVSSGLLRAACLQSHSHPLQCRALELCFNVALNRLPTSTSGPMLGPHSAHQHPTIANALVAAFKRAQAHQRRGSIENQQQPLLAVKIELEQLIISILDDPSVSRVMREAGFSSTLVKGKVEQAVSVEFDSQNQVPNSNKDNNNIDNNIIKVKNNNINIIDSTNHSSCTNILSMVQPGLVKMGKPRLCDEGGVRNEDVVTVIASLVNRKKRSNVVVAECIATLEGLVKEVMDRVEKGEVPEELKEVKFFRLSLSSFGHLSREEVDQQVDELKCVVKTWVDNSSSKGLIIYLDDLKWANEFRASSNILVDQHQPIRRNFYCPIEHMIMEIGKLVLGYGECVKLWLLGIATFQTYMRCRSGQPSLETIWGLHAITIPTDSLGLSLIPDSELPSPLSSKRSEISGSSWLMLDGGGSGGGGGNGGRVEDNSRSPQSSSCDNGSNNSILPPWLRQYKDENTKRTSNMSDQDTVPVKDLCKRWNTKITTSSMNISQLQTSSPSFERSLSFSSISPSSSTSNFSYDPHHLKMQPTHKTFERNHFTVNETGNKSHEPTFTKSIQIREDDHHPKRPTSLFIASNPNSTPTSTSSSNLNDPMELDSSRSRVKEYTAENLRTLCSALEQKVPWEKDIIFDIASTILHCRSGSSATRKVSQRDSKEDTWLFFQGVDVDAKECVAREIARVVFGSKDKFISIGLSNFSSTRVDSMDDSSRNKRLRDDQSCMYIERFAKELSKDNHRVFFIEDVDQVDYCSQMGIKKAIERGKIFKYSNEEEVSFGDAIIILSCERFSSRSRACSPSSKQKEDVLSQDNNDHEKMMMNNKDDVKESSFHSLSLDLNLTINDDDDNNDKNGNYGGETHTMDEIGLLALVDRNIVFKNHL